MRPRIDAADGVSYPDVLVHCGSTSNPTSTLELTKTPRVVEVLSATTQHFDRGEKLRAYRQLPGLQHIRRISSLEQLAWASQWVPAVGEWSTLAP